MPDQKDIRAHAERIRRECDDILDYLDVAEVDPGQAAELRAVLEGDVEAFIHACQSARRMLLGQVAAAKAELELVRASMVRAEARLDALDGVVIAALERYGEGKTCRVESERVSVGLAWKPGRVVIEEWVPADLLPHRVKQVIEPDKKAIKDAIEAGQKFAGVTVVRERRVNW